MVKDMRRVILIAIALLIPIGVVGAGCSATKKQQARLESSLLIKELNIYGVIPKDWVSAPFNTLYRNSQSSSGFGYVVGAINQGFGPQNSSGEITTKIHVIAVPKASMVLYEKNKYPQYAQKRFETKSHVIYTATPIPSDPEVERLVGSLKEGE